MVRIDAVSVYELEYAESEFVSELIRLADVLDFSFNVYCSVDCIMEIRYIMNQESLEVVHTETKSVIGGTFNTINSLVKSSHVIFAVVDIASNPCELQCQGFFNLL